MSTPTTVLYKTPPPPQVVDVRLSDNNWPKVSIEAKKLAVDLDYDCLSYVHFFQFLIPFAVYCIPSIQGLSLILSPGLYC